MVNEKQAARNKPTPRSQAFKLRKNLGDAIPPTTSPDNSDKSHQPHCFSTLSALLQSGLMLSKTTKSPLHFIFQSAMDLMGDCSKAYQAFPDQLSVLELKNADLQKQLEDINAELEETKTSLTAAQQQVEAHRTKQELYAQLLHDKGRLIRKRERDNTVAPTPAQTTATISTLHAVLRHQDARYEELQATFVTTTDQLLSSTKAMIYNHKSLIKKCQDLKYDVASYKSMYRDLYRKSFHKPDNPTVPLRPASARTSTPAASVVSAGYNATSVLHARSGRFLALSIVSFWVLTYLMLRSPLRGAQPILRGVT